MSVLDDWSLPTIPSEIKHLAAYFQRAQELRTRDPVMAYWCAFYGLQVAISVKGQPVNHFIANVLPVLEQIKAGNSDNETISNDAAATAYVEKFALRVFSAADNEDRKGLATRATAKRFLASANFLEVVQVFRLLTPEESEKIRYAKWKAADIAKAFREGRKPTPGDARSLHSPTDLSQTSPAYAPVTLDHSSSPPPFALAPSPSDVSPNVPGNVALPPSDNGDGSPGHPSLVSPSSNVQDSMGVPSTPPPHASLLGVGKGQDTPGMWSTVATPGAEYFPPVSGETQGSPSDRSYFKPRAEEPLDDTHDDAWSTAGNMAASRQNSWTITDAAQRSPTNELGLHGDSSLPTGGAPANVKRVHFSPSVVGGLSSASNSVAGSSPPGSPERYTPSLPTVNEVTYSSELVPQEAGSSPRMYPLPESESSTSDAAASPQALPPVIHKVTSPVSPNGALARSPPTTYNAFPVEPPVPILPTPPSHHELGQSPTKSLSKLPSSPSLPVRDPDPQTSNFHPTPYFAAKDLSDSSASSSPAPPPQLTLSQISQVQKLCRFAISALDFEDAETARAELKKALAMLGG